MRHSLNMSEPPKNKRIEDKLVFLEGTATELIGENHKLKEDLILSKKRYESVFEELIKEIQLVEATQKAKQVYVNQIEQFKAIVRDLISSMKDLKLKLSCQQSSNAELTSEMESLQRTVASLTQQLLAQQSSLALLTANHQLLLDKKTTEMKAELDIKSASVGKLTIELEVVRQQILELHNSYNSQNQLLRKEISDLKQEHKVEVWEVNDSFTRQMRKIRNQYENQRKQEVQKYLEVIQIKKEENEALVKMITSQGRNIASELDGIRMIEFRQSLMGQIEGHKEQIKGLRDEIDNLKDKINQGNKKYMDLANSNFKKLEEIERNKALLKDFEKKLDSCLIQNQELKLQIENNKKYKAEQDKIHSARWEQQLQRIAMNYQIKQRYDVEEVKTKYEKELKERQIVFECEITTLNEKQSELIESIRRLQNLYKKLQEDNKLSEQQLIKKQRKIDELKLQMIKEISQRQERIQAFIIDIEQFESKINKQKEKINNLKDEIELKNLFIETQKISFEKQHEQLKETHKQQLQKQTEQSKTLRQQALKHLRQDLQFQFQLQTSKILKKHHQQLTKVKSSRDQIEARLMQEKQSLEKNYQQAIDLIKKQEKQLKYSLQTKLREEKHLRKQQSEKFHHEIYALKIELGKDSKTIQQLSKRIDELSQQLTKSTQVKDNLLQDLIEFKKNIVAQRQNSEKLKGVIKQKENDIIQIKLNLVQEQSRYKRVKGQIISIRDDLIKEMKKQEQRHYKIVVFYRNRIRELQTYIVGRTSQTQFMNQIEELKAQKSSLDTSLLKCQAQLIKVKDISSYHEAEANSLKEKCRSLKKSTDESFDLDLKQKSSKRLNSTSRVQNSISALSQYQKFSSSRKKKLRYKVVEYSSMQSGLMNYSMVTSLRQTFRLRAPKEGHLRSKTQANI